uniref:Uncharacterized protein n=1 Tax=Cucumis melo TaxID=3656 RepID=A0A9I9E642_CUCME
MRPKLPHDNNSPVCKNPSYQSQIYLNSKIKREEFPQPNDMTRNFLVVPAIATRSVKNGPLFCLCFLGGIVCVHEYCPSTNLCSRCNLVDPQMAST